MTFNYDNAKKIAEHYKFLFGYFLDTENKEYKITDIVVAPVDSNQYSKFSIAYVTNKNNDLALQKSGFDIDNVDVLLLHVGFTLLIKEPIDYYLTKNKIEKIYVNPNF